MLWNVICDASVDEKRAGSNTFSKSHVGEGLRGIHGVFDHGLDLLGVSPAERAVKGVHVHSDFERDGTAKLVESEERVDVELQRVPRDDGHAADHLQTADFQGLHDLVVELAVFTHYFAPCFSRSSWALSSTTSARRSRK